MAGPFDNGADPFASFLSARNPPSALDSVRGTEVDPDPFGAFMARRARTAPLDNYQPGALRKGFDWFMDATPLQDYGGAQLEDALNKRGYGRSAAAVEGVARQFTPANTALMALSTLRGAMKLPELYRAGADALVGAGPGAKTAMATHEAMRLGDVALGGLQVGEGGAQTKEAIDEGDTRGALIGGGMTAIGALGVAAGLRPTRGRIIGEVLPPAVDRIRNGDVIPPDINVYPSTSRADRMLEDAPVDQSSPSGTFGTRFGSGDAQSADPIEAFLNGRSSEQKRLYPPGLPPGSEPPRPPGRGNPSPEPPVPAGDMEAPRPTEPEGSGQPGVAVGADAQIAAERLRLSKQGYPPALIDQILEKFIAGDTEPPRAGGVTPPRIEPTDQAASTPESMAAAKARRQAELEASGASRFYDAQGNTLPPPVAAAPPADDLETALRQATAAQDAERAARAAAAPPAPGRDGHFRLPNAVVPDDVYDKIRDSKGIAPSPAARALRDPGTLDVPPNEPLSDAFRREFGAVETGDGSGVESPDAALARLLETDRAPQRAQATPGGLGPRGSVIDRPVGGGTRAVAPTRTERDVLGELAADARAHGYAGTDEQLQQLLAEHSDSARSLQSDLQQISEENGPQALLQAIRKAGGLRPSDTEIGSGRQLRGNLASLSESFRAGSGLNQQGAASIFRTKGKAIDDLLQTLQQDPRWKHLDENQLLEDLDNIARGVHENYDVPGFENALRASGVRRGERWWEPQVDTLDTGEAQPRLPGDVGAARDTEIATPREEVPFSLERQTATRGDVQPGLADLEREVGAAPPATESGLERIQSRHEITKPNVLRVLTESMQRNGWQGRPMLVLDHAGTETSWTATHRLEAAKAAGLTRADVPTVRIDGAALERAGYDVAELSKQGKNARIAALRSTGQNEAAQLLEDEKKGSPVRAQAPGAPASERVPQNVYHFVKRQLGWTDAELDGMSSADIYALGRDRTKSPNAPERAPRPEPVVTRPEGESYDASRLGPIDDQLEHFLSDEVPQRQARAAATREALIRRQGVPASEVNQPSDRMMPAPVTKRDALATRAASRANDRAMDADIAGRVARQNETKSERQSRVARIQGEQRASAREMADAFQRGDYKRFSDLVGDAVDRFWNRQRKMGTGEPGVRRDERGDILEGGILPGFSMLGKVARDPKKYAILAAEMLRNPAIRSAVGAVAGYASGNTPEESLNRALQGAALAALAPSGLRALRKAFLLARDGHAPVPYTDPKSTDISMWRLIYAPSPERTVPELFREAQDMLDNLQRVYASKGLSTEQKLKAASFTRRELASFFEDAADEARAAGLKRKGWYADAIARRLAGRPTAGEKVIAGFLDPIFGKDEAGRSAFDPRSIERHSRTIIYRTLVGYGLDTAAQNLTQPILSLLHVAPGDLLAGYRAARTDAGKALTKKLDLLKPTHVNEDIISEAKQIAGKGDTGAARPGSVRDIATDPGRMLRATDNLNRRVVYLAALQRQGVLDGALRSGAAPDAADRIARSIVRRTQGNQGPLGNNPFHKGPIAGTLSTFQKFPGLFLENMMDAFNDPKTRGRALVASMLGLVAAGQLMGISTEDLLVSGGRPLGIDVAHPMDTLRRGARIFPAGRAIMDVADHVAGSATHPIAALPGKGFLDSDLAELTMGRYPVKATKAISDVLGQGLGTHAQAARDQRPAHTGVDDLESLVGIKSTKRVEQQQAAADAARFTREAKQQAKQDRQGSYDDLDRAVASGDAAAVAQARRKLSPAQLRAYDRSAQQTPYDRRRAQVPAKDRAEFDRRFKGRLR